jgi:putative PEP-CTERM system TPR-repeat lipoprotein
MPPRFPARTTLAVAALASVLALGGCAKDDEASLLASARAHLEKKQVPAATIELKKLLQKKPDSGEGRFLLGKALQDGGDPGSAVLELRKARELGYSADAVVPELARALLATGQAKVVIDEMARVELGAPAARADLLGSVAMAHAMSGRADAAEAALAEASKADPKSSRVRLMEARRLGGRGSVDQALALVDGILRDEPKNTGALVLKSELLWAGKARPEAAIEPLRQVLAFEPANVRAHVLIVQIHLQRNDAAQAKAQIAALVKAAPGSYEALFYRTQQALMDNDWTVAREGVQQLMKLTPTHGPALLLAGTVELQTNQLELANKHLAQAMAAMPNAPLARRTLAEAQMRWGQSDRALSTLAPMLAQSPPDAQALGLAAAVHLQTGDLPRAQELYERAARADPADSRPRIGLALARMSRGDLDGGLEQLRGIAAADKATHADLALISALFRQQRFEQGLQAVDRLEGKLPKDPLVHLLRARLLAAQKKLDDAEASLKKALASDPMYFPAVIDLASLDIGRGRPDAAMKHVQAVLDKDPRHVQAELALLDLRRRSGASPADIERAIVAAVAKHPGVPEMRLALVMHHLSARQPSQALRAAQEAVVAFPQEPTLLDAQATALLATGDAQQAIAALRRLATLQPNSPAPHLRLAEVYTARKEFPAASQSLNAALEAAPNLLAAKRAQVQLELARKRPQEALKVARSVQQQRPREAIGWLLESDIHVVEKAYPAASEAARAALDREPSPAQAVRLHTLYGLAGRSRDAEALAADWQRQHPGDAEFIFQLGVAAMQRGDDARAETLFRRVLEVVPGNGSALNNIATLLVKQKSPQALEYAQKAHATAPDNPEIMDTLASALAANQQPAKALEWQRKAVEKRPESAQLRLNLAKLLVANGDKQQAKAELDKLAKLGGRFAGHAEVDALLKTL